MEDPCYNNIDKNQLNSESKSALIGRKQFKTALSDYMTETQDNKHNLVCMHCKQDADFVCLAQKCQNRVFCFYCLDDEHKNGPVCSDLYIMISKLASTYKPIEPTKITGSENQQDAQIKLKSKIKEHFEKFTGSKER